MSDRPKYKKKSIPKSVRNKVWTNCNGDHFASKCYVCRVKITVFNFECGHVIAEHNGGATSADNLKTICLPCNRSMGTRNLEEFRSTHFPERRTCWNICG